MAEPIKMENFDEKIEPYLLGELSEAELIAFEKLLKTDAALAKSVAEHREMMERLEALRLRKKIKKFPKDFIICLLKVNLKSY